MFAGHQFTINFPGEDLESTITQTNIILLFEQRKRILLLSLGYRFLHTSLHRIMYYRCNPTFFAAIWVDSLYATEKIVS